MPGANSGSELAPAGRPICIARQVGASRLTISATARAHLKIASERSSTILLWASRALQFYRRYPPAAARCRSPRPGRCGTGAGHGLPATRVATGCILRVPAVGDRVLGHSGCCVVLQDQAAPQNRAQSPSPPTQPGPMRDWTVASIEGSSMFLLAITRICCGASCPISTQPYPGKWPPSTHVPCVIRTYPLTIGKSVL